MRVIDFVTLGYHHGYGGGWTDWMANVAISSLIHAMICGLVMRHLSLGEVIVLGVVVLGCMFMWSRARDRRG